MRQGPLTGRYPAVAAIVVFALVPYLGLSAALQRIGPIIAGQLHMSMQAMNLALGMGNTAYAIGAVFAVQFALRLQQRRIQAGVPKRLTLVPTAHNGAAPVSARPPGAPTARVDDMVHMPREANERRAR